MRRQGTVSSQPRENSTNIAVVLDGNTSFRYFPIKDLRYLINGVTPEEHPPMEGEPPIWRKLGEETAVKPPRTPTLVNGDGSIEAMFAARRVLRAKLDEMEEQIFLALLKRLQPAVR